MATHFLADTHLIGDDDPGAEAFRRYCRGPAREADAVYLLGDLFDVWIGDDGSLAPNRQCVDAIGELAASGTPVYFIRGNRDFLVGPDFVAVSGVTILDDPWAGPVEGIHTLLAHGDVLCTNDLAHQRFRARYTDPRWRRWMLRTPLWLRRLAARRARRYSAHRQVDLDEDVLGVDAGTLARLAGDTGARRVIHGHTHRPADDHLAGVERHVLADWRPAHREYLLVDGETCSRHVID